MSDIPVGSPPVPPGRHAAPSGWYADPIDAGQERYWDGWQWSRNTRAREGTAAPGQGPAGYPPQPGLSANPGYSQYPGYPQQGPSQPWTGQPTAGRPGQATMTADGVPLAGWWWRALAAIVDGVFVGILGSLASLPLLLPMIRRLSAFVAQSMEAARQGQVQPPPPSTTELLPVGDQLMLSLIAVAISFVYQVVFLHWRGATPGKLICGLRVVPVDRGRYRDRLAWGSVSVRALVWTLPGLSSLLFLVRLLDVLFPLWQPKRQALHDLAARTQVVKP
ncbi:MAG: RDD family protein [Friedmanniella sp.]